ncbi:MAG: hypothetical protein JNL43_07640 [Flavobacteriales bacterium]|nr:hypothetical protein [Flavobacteriales bacterium]
MRTYSAFSALILASGLAAQWSQMNTGLATLDYGAAIHGATPNYIFARAYNVLYRSDDHGGTWTSVPSPSTWGPSDVGYYFNDRYVVGTSAIGTCLHYSDNEGNSWSPATGGPTATAVRGFFEYGGALYAYTDQQGIYRTFDGAAWTAVNSGLTSLDVVGMAAVGPFFVAATNGGGVFRTINSNSWTQATGIGSADLDGEHVWQMGGNVHYSAQGGVTYRSTDIGLTFTEWTAPAFFGVGLEEVKRFGSNNLYMETRHFAGGERDSLYRSTNNGGAWTNITGNLDAADLRGSGIFEYDGYVFIAYTMGSLEGIYRYTLSTGIADAERLEAVTVFPNPTSDNVMIKLPFMHGAERYTLHDALGAQISAGTVTSTAMQLDLSGVGPGCYLLRWDDALLAPVRLVKQR